MFVVLSRAVELKTLGIFLHDTHTHLHRTLIAFAINVVNFGILFLGETWNKYLLQQMPSALMAESRSAAATAVSDDYQGIKSPAASSVPRPIVNEAVETGGEKGGASASGGASSSSAPRTVVASSQKRKPSTTPEDGVRGRRGSRGSELGVDVEVSEHAAAAAAVFVDAVCNACQDKGVRQCRDGGASVLALLCSNRTEVIVLIWKSTE